MILLPKTPVPISTIPIIQSDHDFQNQYVPKIKRTSSHNKEKKIYIGSVEPKDLHIAHRAAKDDILAVVKLLCFITNSDFADCNHGTPGTVLFVSLWAFGSPVWMKLAKAPVYPWYVKESVV